MPTLKKPNRVPWLPPPPKPFEGLKASNEEIYRNVYNTARWRAIRDQVRQQEPLCRLCGKRATHTVDHIIPIKNGGDPWDRSNLQGLCWACNKRKTGKQAKGGVGSKD